MVATVGGLAEALYHEFPATTPVLVEIEGKFYHVERLTCTLRKNYTNVKHAKDVDTDRQLVLHLKEKVNGR